MPAEAETKVEQYQLVRDESTFNILVFADGLLSSFGHNPVIAVRDFNGTAEVVPDTFSVLSLSVTIRSNSFKVGSEVSQKDRVEIERTMRDQVLEVEKFPEITFTSTNVTASRLGEGRYRARIIGDLTLHGVTQKNLWITAEVKAVGEKLRGQGEFTIKQSDFKIKLASAVGGMLKVKNDLKCSFDIVAAPVV
jgi:polyisoprenoid-binding protein YceI